VEWNSILQGNYEDLRIELRI